TSSREGVLSYRQFLEMQFHVRSREMHLTARLLTRSDDGGRKNCHDNTTCSRRRTKLRRCQSHLETSASEQVTESRRAWPAWIASASIAYGSPERSNCRRAPGPGVCTTPARS